MHQARRPLVWLASLWKSTQGRCFLQREQYLLSIVSRLPCLICAAVWVVRVAWRNTFSGRALAFLVRMAHHVRSRMFRASFLFSALSLCARISALKAKKLDACFAAHSETLIHASSWRGSPQPRVSALYSVLVISASSRNCETESPAHSRIRVITGRYGDLARRPEDGSRSPPPCPPACFAPPAS